jgi:hypothetical protein
MARLQHWVSNFTDVKRGFTAGLRMSASSLLISASISPPASESSSSVAPLIVCSPYSLVAYYGFVSVQHLWVNLVFRWKVLNSTYYLEQISQICNGWCFFLHGASCPNAHVTRIDLPGFSVSSPWHIPSLLALSWTSVQRTTVEVHTSKEILEPR